MCVSYDPVANGRRLQEIRLSRELTPEDVSRNTEVSVKALHAYESGERNPRDDIKLQLCDFYGVMVQDVFYPNKGSRAVASLCSGRFPRG